MHNSIQKSPLRLSLFLGMFSIDLSILFRIFCMIVLQLAQHRRETGGDSILILMPVTFNIFGRWYLEVHSKMG